VSNEPLSDEYALASTMLQELAGPNAVLREDQWQAISCLRQPGARLLVVQATGWGKSAVYFLTALLGRRAGLGPALIVSPLLALMRNQIQAAERAGIRAVTLNSANPHEWEQVHEQIANNEVDVLLISPERLNAVAFREQVMPQLRESIGLLVVDEAHSISDWGHDFRPDYMRISELVQTLSPTTSVLATTATANDRVVRDVLTQIGGDRATVLRGSLDRPSLHLDIVNLPTSAARLAWVDAYLKQSSGSGIVYALTVAAAEESAAWLRERGHAVEAYTGRTEDAERRRIEAALGANELKAVIATSALGMGYDKPDLSHVIHMGAPSSPVTYYQQVGRAGRGSVRAEVILLPGVEDEQIWAYFESLSFPPAHQVDALLAALDGDKSRSTAALEVDVDLSRSRLEAALKVLEVAGAVRREKGGWVRTSAPYVYDHERYAQVSEARAAEKSAMRTYQRTTECLMLFLRRHLDDEQAQACQRCSRCLGRALHDLDVDAIPAQDSMTRAGVEVPPRKMYPTGMPEIQGRSRSGRIPAELSCEPGRVVARLTGIGLGSVVREALTPTAQDAGDVDAEHTAHDAGARLSPALAQACVDVLRDWGWQERPTIIVTMPSRGSGRLISEVAAHLGTVGRLPVHEVLQYIPGQPRRRQSEVFNSAHKLINVVQAFTVTPQGRSILEGAIVLLVDDVVDSGWSMQAAGEVLLAAGAAKILPFALATTA
jgi:ATP-dependent DNA helicase RecQ